MNLTNGKQKLPMRAVIYGPEGIGKSTLAAQFPRPIFIDLDKGTGQLDVVRGTVQSWSELLAGIDALPVADYDTLVIDTIDAAEKLAIAHICAKADKSGLEAFGWGHGYTMLAEEIARMLDKLTLIYEKHSKNVLLLAHNFVKKWDQPDEFGAFDRYQMTLEKKAVSKVKAWADTVLFLNYKIHAVTDDSGKTRGQGGERVIFTQHHPCWDAKNRYDWPEKIKLPKDRSMPAEIAGVLTPTPGTAKTEPPAIPPAEEKTVKPPAAPAVPAATDDRPPLPDDPEICEKLKQLSALMKTSGVSVVELDAFMTKKGVVPPRTHPYAFNLQTLNRIITGWAAVKTNIERRREMQK